jgi:hypothetical protein
VLPLEDLCWPNEEAGVVDESAALPLGAEGSVKSPIRGPGLDRVCDAISLEFSASRLKADPGVDLEPVAVAPVPLVLKRLLACPEEVVLLWAILTLRCCRDDWPASGGGLEKSREASSFRNKKSSLSSSPRSERAEGRPLGGRLDEKALLLVFVVPVVADLFGLGSGGGLE